MCRYFHYDMLRRVYPPRRVAISVMTRQGGSTTPRRVLFSFRPGEEGLPYHHFRLDATRVSTPHRVIISLTERAQKVHCSLFFFPFQILTTLQDFDPTKRCTPPCWVIYTTVIHLTPLPHPSLTFLATPSLVQLRDMWLLEYRLASLAT